MICDQCCRKLAMLLNSWSDEVKSDSFRMIAELIHSPEMKQMVSPLIDAIISPGDKTTPCVEQLMDVTFINAVDGPCLSLMVPVLSRALKERRSVACIFCHVHTRSEGMSHFTADTFTR